MSDSVAAIANVRSCTRTSLQLHLSLSLIAIKEAKEFFVSSHTQNLQEWLLELVDILPNLTLFMAEDVKALP